MKKAKSIFELGVVGDVVVHASHSTRFKKKPKQKKKKNKVQIKHFHSVPQDYKKYIKSKFWRNRRKKFYQTHKRECAACKSKKELNVHHLVYKNYGNEEDKDLVILCRVCHENYHIKNGVRHDNFDTTQQFIIDEQEANELREITDRF